MMMSMNQGDDDQRTINIHICYRQSKDGNTEYALTTFIAAYRHA